MFNYKFCYTCQAPSQETECVADPMDGTNVDDYNPDIIPVGNKVDNIYPSSPGVHITPSERIILEQTDGDSTYVHQPSHLISDNPPISFLYNGDSLPAPSNLTRNYATDVPQSSNGITSYILDTNASSAPEKEAQVHL
nr:uncharacterized protein LOC120976433 [Aegilops tauschii subsp. strangulata]